MTLSFYVISSTSEGGRETFSSSPATAGPWGPGSQHGSPPSALLGRAVERLPGTGRLVGRLTVELLGPVPVGPLAVEATVVRPGRRIELCAATLYDVERDRPVSQAHAWRFPDGVEGPRPEPSALLHGPDDGEQHPLPSSWSPGYLQAVDWRWIEGGVGKPGPAVVWMRPRLDLVEGEGGSPLQRLLACVDSASGVSSELDPAVWGFQNTELTVHLLRQPVGDWFCLAAETTLGGGAVGVATSAVYDEHGLVARTAQTLLVQPRQRD